jgi:hypothetical protein
MSDNSVSSSSSGYIQDMTSCAGAASMGTYFDPNSVNINTAASVSYIPSSFTFTGGTGAVSTGTTIATSYLPVAGSTMGVIGGYGGGYYAAQSNPIPLALSVMGKEIVRINLDGSITWPNGIDEEEGAKAFSQSVMVGAEMAAGINQKVKLAMRDSVFEDLIEIAKEKGSLTAEDLTFLLQASKIVEKLKGSKD